MATFLNLSVSPVELTDENGITYHFEGGEERSGLSNYFDKYTSSNTQLTTPILRLTGDLDGDGTIPTPAIPRDNTVFEPGVNAPYSYTATPTDTGTPTVAPVDISGATGPRRKRVTIDTQHEVANAGRRIDARFLDVAPLPLLRHATTGLAISGLNASKTAQVATGYFPVASNGVKATAADAAANPAVEEGENYTAFGDIVVTDASPSQTGTFYYSIKGTSDYTFAAADDNDASLPDPDTASIVLATGVITFTAFTGGASGDSAVASINSALEANTAAKLVTAIGSLAASRDGMYRNLTTGQLFMVEGAVVAQFTPTATATLS